MRRSVRRVLGMGVVLGTMGLAFSGSALGAVVGTSPIPTYQANGRVYTITVANGTVYIGGSFTSVLPAGSGGSSTTRNRVAAFDEATGTVAGSARTRRAAFDTSTGSLTSWAPSADALV